MGASRSVVAVLGATLISRGKPSSSYASTVKGGPPETEADWRRVAETLRRLHRLTPGWPQRPGWRASTDLLHAETGTRIDSVLRLPFNPFAPNFNLALQFEA